LIGFCLVVYLSVTEQSRGSSFKAGFGDAGQPLEVQKLEGFGDELMLENALAVDV
jgi:hypothetical protein